MDLSTPIKLAIVDEDQLIVDLLRFYFNYETKLNIIFTALNGSDCLDQLNQSKYPDILLMDVQMKLLNGIETLEQIRKTGFSVKTILISSDYNKSFIGFMFKSGACAYVPKNISPNQLLEIIIQVHINGYFFLDDQIEIVRFQLSNTPKPIFKNLNILTVREIEVIRLICQQKTSKEIATKLFITQSTVEGHKNNLFLKTGAKNIAGLVIYAIQNKIIEVEELPLI
jgi:DNA-binding NarL/FixJ family response regulator